MTTPLAKALLFAMIVLLPAHSLAFLGTGIQLERGIYLEVYFDNLVPELKDQEKMRPFIEDEEAFKKEMGGMLVSALEASPGFMGKLEDNSTLFLCGQLYSFEGGLRENRITYLVLLLKGRQKVMSLEIKEALKAVPIRCVWPHGTPLNEVLKPKIKEVVNQIIKEEITDNPKAMKGGR